MVVTASGIIICRKLLHPQNKFELIDSIDNGKVMSVIFLQLQKAWAPIVVIEPGSVKYFRLVQL